MALPDCTEEELQALYEWVDAVPLSRPKKSIARDFADGVLMAELVHHFFPRLVELHNYSPAHNSVQKMYNWTTLNQKVFKRMGFMLAREQYEAVANADTGAIERVLKHARTKMARFQQQQTSSRPRSQAAAVEAGGDSPPDSPAGQLYGLALGGGAADAIAALRLGEQPCQPAGPSFQSLEAALEASLADKEQQLEELRDTNEILETKISKLEQLVRLKDAKIQALLARLEAAADGTQPGGAQPGGSGGAAGS